MNKLNIVILIILCISCRFTKPIEGTKSIKEYYDNGQLKITVDTLNGDFNGVLKYYYSDGAIKSIQHWINGLPSGDFLFYNEKGDLIQHEKFFNDSNTYELLIGNPDTFYSVYDDPLIKLYSKNIRIIPDTAYYIGVNNFITIKNIPNQLLGFDSNNGIVQQYKNQWIAKIKTIDRNLVIKCYVIQNGQYTQLFTIEREIKGKL
jgi:hypothetical protein